MTALGRARAATRERLVNCLLRELAPPVHRRGDELRIDLGAAALVVGLRSWSPTGQHRLADAVGLDTGGGVRPAGHDEVVAAVLAAVADHLAPSPIDVDDLTRRIDGSTARTACFLAAPAPPGGDPVRDAEQSLRRGHPFHPTPKSAEGLDPAHAPELGVDLVLHRLEVAPGLLVGDDVTPGAPWPTLPVHPAQDALLRADPTLAVLAEHGELRHLGPVGPRVYPTSSVRTVCDPATGGAWKLPLRVRITNFVRTTPVEHARRALDAARVVAALRSAGGLPAGLEMIIETGYRTLDPQVVGEPLAAELTVLAREAPRAGLVPLVLAGLLEDAPDGGPPALLDAVDRSGASPAAWLRAFVGVSLVPLLAVFGAHGLGLEAHPQNALVHLDGGWPRVLLVRDLEGAHVRRSCIPAGVDPASPLVYDDEEAWTRLRYHAVTNQLASVVAALGRHPGGPGEEALWSEVAGALAAVRGPGRRWAGELLDAETLPAKANLLSLAAGHGEDPRYVGIENPIRAAR